MSRMDHIDASSYNNHWMSGRYSHSRKILTGNIDVTNNGSIVNAFDPNGAARNVRLPPIEPGRFFVVANSGATGTLNVVDANSVLIVTLDPGASTMLFASATTWVGVAGGMGLDVFGPVGPTHSEGLVPDPGPGSPSSPHRYLAETGVWETVAGLVASNAYFFGHKGGAVTLTPAGSETLEFLSAGAALTILGQSGTTPKSLLFTVNASGIDHNALLNYSANQHVDHTAVTLTAGLGLSGGGTIAASRTFDFSPNELTAVTPALTDFAVWDLAAGGPRRGLWSAVNGILDHNALLNYSANRHIDHSAVSIVASTGLTGGGDITTSRSLSLNFAGLVTDTVAAGSTFAFFDPAGGDHNKATLSAINAAIDHNALVNYVADQHVAHTSVSISTTEGIQGGGNIAATRTLKLDINGLAEDLAPALSDFIVMFDVSAGTHKKSLASSFPKGISDAPSNNTLYARENAGWTALPRITVSATAPSSPAVNDVWIDTN
jgi:hypothetical protein